MSDLPLSDLALLRRVLARELDTISEYEAYAELAKEESLRAFFQHLADEEKEHVAEAMALINDRDAEQKRHWEEADTRPEHFAGGRAVKTPGAAHAPAAAEPKAAEKGAEPAPPPPQKPVVDIGYGGQLRPGGQFTVGSLKRS